MSYQKELASKEVARYLRIQRKKKSDSKYFEEHVAQVVLRRTGHPFTQLNTEQGKKQERPDIIAYESKSLTIGIEVTELYASDTQAKEHHDIWTAWTEFAEDIQNELRRKGLAHLYASIMPHQPKNGSQELFARLPKGEARRTMLQELVSLAQHLSQKNGSYKFDARAYPVTASFASSLAYLNTYPEECYWWRADLQSGLTPMTTTDIQRDINNKRAKAQEYEWDNANERWLIMVARSHGIIDIAPRINSINDFEKLRIDPFTSIFIWEWFSNDIHQISHNAIDNQLHLTHVPETGGKPT